MDSSLGRTVHFFRFTYVEVMYHLPRNLILGMFVRNADLISFRDFKMSIYNFLMDMSHTAVRLCDPIDGSPPGSTIPRIFQARVLEWGAIAFSDESYWPCANLSSFSNCWSRWWWSFDNSVLLHQCACPGVFTWIYLQILTGRTDVVKTQRLSNVCFSLQIFLIIIVRSFFVFFFNAFYNSKHH